MPLQGDITTFSISAIGRLIHAEKKTGLLKVTSGQHRTVIYFKNGGIVFVDGDLAKDLSLGSLLKANNLVNEENIQKSLKISKTTGKRLGIVLIEQGLLSQEKLIRILHHQFKEAIAKALSWNLGEYTYSDGLEGYVEDIRLEINPIRLVAEAQKWKQYRKLIPNDQVVFQIKGAALQSKSFSAEGIQRVMLLVNGKRTVAQIMADAGISRLGVYKALAFMLSRGAIVRTSTRILEEPTPLDTATVINYYFNLLQEMMAGLNLELGSKKAASVLLKSLNHSPYFSPILGNLEPAADLSTNLSQMLEFVKNPREQIPPQDLIKGFNHIAADILLEECQLLGFRASQDTLNRVGNALKDVPKQHTVLVRNSMRFLNHYCANTELLKGLAVRLEPMGPGRDSAPPKSQLPHAPADHTGEAEIITFYSNVIQEMIRGLQNEIGSKALDLFQNIVKNSQYHETFLSQFDVKGDIKTNVNRIQERMQLQGHKYGKQDLATAFQNLLVALLQEENRLLGEKFTRLSIVNLEKHLTEQTPAKHKPLANQLMRLLKSSTSWT